MGRSAGSGQFASLDTKLVTWHKSNLIFNGSQTGESHIFLQGSTDDHTFQSTFELQCYFKIHSLSPVLRHTWFSFGFWFCYLLMARPSPISWKILLLKSVEYIYIYIYILPYPRRVEFSSERSNHVAISVYCKSLHIWIEVSVAVKRMYVNNSNCDS